MSDERRWTICDEHDRQIVAGPDIPLGEKIEVMPVTENSTALWQRDRYRDALWELAEKAADPWARRTARKALDGDDT
jgi:hypothetical protein